MNKCIVIIFVLFLLSISIYAIDVSKVEWKNGILKGIIFSADTNTEGITVNFLDENTIIDSLVTTDFVIQSPGNYLLSTDKKINGKNVSSCEFLISGSFDENMIVNCGLKGRSYSDVIYYF